MTDALRERIIEILTDEYEEYVTSRNACDAQVENWIWQGFKSATQQLCTPEEWREIIAIVKAKVNQNI